MEYGLQASFFSINPNIMMMVIANHLQKYKVLQCRRSNISSFYQIPVHPGIADTRGGCPFSLKHNKGKLRKVPVLETVQKPLDRVALVTGKTKPVTKLLNGNPPLVGSLLLHELLKKFRHARIFSHLQISSPV
jgi:hypothetical protein